MRYHIVNGDMLAEQLRLTNPEGEIIVCRECLSDGPHADANLSDFLKLRVDYIQKEYGESPESYLQKSISEFFRVLNIEDGSEVNLWFEDDLFCQVNMWFVLSLLFYKKRYINVNRIFPVTVEKDHWKGFGAANEEALIVAYSLRVKFEADDIETGSALWEAFSTDNYSGLADLSLKKSYCFRYLEDVCRAHIERYPPNGHGRPERVVKEIISSGKITFQEVYSEFFDREGIYGFSDIQIKKIYDEIISLN